MTARTVKPNAAKGPRLKKLDVLVHPHCARGGLYYDGEWRKSIDRTAQDKSSAFVIFSNVANRTLYEGEPTAKRDELVRYARDKLGRRLVVTTDAKRLKGVLEARGFRLGNKVGIEAYGMYYGICVPMYAEMVRSALKQKRYRTDLNRSVEVRAINP